MIFRQNYQNFYFDIELKNNDTEKMTIINDAKCGIILNKYS